MRRHLFIYTCLWIYSSLFADNPSYQDIFELEQVAFLDCMFSDIYGRSKEVTIPRGLIDNAIQHGLPVDGSLIATMSPNESDLMLKLNMDTLTMVPWTENDSKTARVICNVCHTTQKPYEHDARYFLQQAIEEAHAMGYEFVVGPELEFYIYDDQYDPTNHTPYDTKTYFATENNPFATALKRTLFNILLTQNIPIEKIHHAIAPGQYEISVRYNNALTIADQLMITKQTIRALAHAHSLNVTFMPKPSQNYHGNSMHLNCSLWDRTTHQNVFYDENDPMCISAIAKHFMAGILAYIQELNIIFNPTINSYKRLMSEIDAPSYICWGIKNRSALIRVPAINQENDARIELRSADALLSPYLALGVLLKLGLEGIKHKMILADPLTTDVHCMTPEERNYHAIKQLPISFAHAITLFAQSDYAKQIMGNSLHELFLNHKKEEFIRYNSFVTNWELHTYFES